MIEASKASTGNIHVEIKPCNLNVLLAQISGEYEQRLAEQNLTLIASPLPDDILFWQMEVSCGVFSIICLAIFVNMHLEIHVSTWTWL